MNLNGEHIALLVHDLKNPLAALLSNLGFVAQTIKGDEMTLEAVQDCKLSTEVLTRLIENLGVIGTLESATPQTADVSVEAVIANVSDRMSRHAEASAHGLSTYCDPSVMGVKGIGKLIELALDNLIAVSLAYAPQGSTIRLEARSGESGTAVLAVIDEGRPIAADARDCSASKEGQTEAKSSQSGRYGRGLGLYVVNLIARSAGGELKFGEVGGHACAELHLRAV